jgi:hypothetical protein
MDYLGPTLVMYLMAGAAVAVAVYLSERVGSPAERWFHVATAVPFWPLYLPLLLAGDSRPALQRPTPVPANAPDDMAAAIAQVDAELEAALGSLDGWAEDVLAREKGRISELHTAWTVQAARIREMDRLLTLPENAPTDLGLEVGPAGERLRHSQLARRQNLERLRRVRQRAFDDLMGTLAWVRELVSMIHLAKFTGAPAARAEELVAQIAAAVEGLSEVTALDEAEEAMAESERRS